MYLISCFCVIARLWLVAIARPQTREPETSPSPYPLYHRSTCPVAAYSIIALALYDVCSYSFYFCCTLPLTFLTMGAVCIPIVILNAGMVCTFQFPFTYWCFSIVVISEMWREARCHMCWLYSSTCWPRSTKKRELCRTSQLSSMEGKLLFCGITSFCLLLLGILPSWHSTL